MIEQISSFLIGIDKYVLNDTLQTVLEQPSGSTLTYGQAIQLNRDSHPAQSPKQPGSPAILTSPASVTNSALPQNLLELAVQLAPNTDYKFDFRITQYNSAVPIDVSFAAPGDDPADPAADTVMQWNAGPVNGAQLGVDDEFQHIETGDSIEGQLITGTVSTKSLGGMFIPQFRQSVADTTATEIVHAYLEVKENGN